MNIMEEAEVEQRGPVPTGPDEIAIKARQAFRRSTTPMQVQWAVVE